MKNKPLQVFEYGTLPVDEEQFTMAHFNRLVLYNERHGNQFFTVGHKKITFKNYVGVIQVGRLVIEILPKADNNGEDIKKWQNALINMLHECRYLKLKSLTDASLQLRSASLIDLYFDSLLNEVESLVHKGLTKRYRFHEANLTKLKGKLIFSQQVARNAVHKERFYTAHQVYDQDNVYNRILKKALSILQMIATNHHLQQRAGRFLLDFEHVSDNKITANTFRNLTFNRKTEHYRYAVKLARLIILQYAPDLKGGHEDILAILFDMNRLFEQFIYLKLKQAEEEYEDIGLSVLGQERRDFWQGKTIRPDLVLNYREGDARKKLIIDTKWKVLGAPEPSDEDLRQMYAYNLHFGAERSVLMYPKADHLDNTGYLAYEESDFVPGQEHSCQLYFVEVVDETGVIRANIGHRILQDLKLTDNS